VTLPERVVALHRALRHAGIDHAFGGALALAYCTLDPRGTNDVDLNIFVPAADAAAALAALPEGVQVPQEAVRAIQADGQRRLWWDDTPVDVFFDYAPIHADAARHVEHVPFMGIEIPVLGPVELAVFKAMFDRTRDWADIEAMIAAQTLDVDAVAAALQPMLPARDDRFERLAESVRRATQLSS
jgi:hypothetical protein